MKDSAGIEREGGVEAVDQVRLGGEDRRGQGQADRAAGDLEHVDDPAGEAGPATRRPPSLPIVVADE